MISVNLRVVYLVFREVNSRGTVQTDTCVYNRLRKYREFFYTFSWLKFFVIITSNRLLIFYKRDNFEKVHYFWRLFSV